MRLMNKMMTSLRQYGRMYAKARRYSLNCSFTLGKIVAVPRA